jgi:hypothetical protein
MQCHSLTEFIPILQTAVGPALLISGVGLLLLSMINRLHHITDRARKLADQMDPETPQEFRIKAAQVGLLWKRARIVRLAIVFAASSALFAALLVASLFVTTLLNFQDAWQVVGLLFVLAMAALVLSLLCFISDINRSLGALRMELERVGGTLG